MTGTELFAKHKKALLKNDLHADLIAFIDASSPTKSINQISASDRLNGAAVFLNVIAGYEELRNKIAGLVAVSAEEKEVPDTYSAPEL